MITIIYIVVGIIFLSWLWSMTPSGKKTDGRRCRERGRQNTKAY
jgi:hypothetical protein